MKHLSHTDAEIEQSLRAILANSITGPTHPEASKLPVPLNDLKAHQYLTSYYHVTDLAHHFLRAINGEELDAERNIDRVLSAAKTVRVRSVTVSMQGLIVECRNPTHTAQSGVVDVQLADDTALTSMINCLAESGYLTTGELLLTDPGDRIRRLAGDERT